MFVKALATLAVVGVALAQTFSINTPPSIQECQPAALSWTGGTAPYILAAIPAGQTSAAALASIADSVSGTSYTWTVNLAQGTAINIRITDATGAIAYSSALTVQSGSGSACLSSSAGSSATSAGGSASASSSASGAASSGAASSGASASVTSAASSASSAASSASSRVSSAVATASSAISSGASSASSRAASSAASSSAAASSAAATSGGAGFAKASFQLPVLALAGAGAFVFLGGFAALA